LGFIVELVVANKVVEQVDDIRSSGKTVEQIPHPERT